MADETNIIEFPITQGQDEGTAIQVLEVGNFSALQNARFRKSNRLGKRNGYTSKSSLDANGVALGNGNGRLNCLGPFFCAVDDVFYRRNETNGTWSVQPSGQNVENDISLWNRFPEVMPGPIIDPPVQDHPANGNVPTYSGMTTGLGLIWTAEARVRGSTWSVFVSGIDTDTSAVVFTQEISLAGLAASTDTPNVQLLSTDSTIALLVDAFTAGVKSGVAVFPLTSLSVGFGSSATVACIQSAANYYPTSASLLLFAYVLTASPTVFRVGTLNPTTGTVVQLSGVASVGNKTRLSIFGRSAGGVCCSFFDATNQQVQVLDAAFVQTGFFAVTATVATAVGPVMFAERLSAPTYKLVALFKDIVGGGPATIFDVCALDFSDVGAVPAAAARQRNSELISQPFTVTDTVDSVYVWIRGMATSTLGVATLVRVPHQSEWKSISTNPGVFPAQATVDDRDVAAPLGASSAGPPFPTPRRMSNGYNALLSYTRSSFVLVGSTQIVRSVALVPVRHLTEGPRYAMSCVVPVIDRFFIAGGQPQWVNGGSLSAQEAGFIQQPLLLGVATETTTGGGLTLLAAYSYTVVFESIVGGVVERSAPAVPVTFTLTGGNDTITTAWIVAEMTSRRQVTGKIYRTAANGSVFYFVNKFDARPENARYFSLVDTQSDADIIQNEALYINIGQEVAASNVPACSFANVGGNRLWCGGGFSGNIVQASKQFAPHLAPEFTDDDAWRITLPANCTGAAWCDSQVLFTQEGIYVVSGDGPDVSGSGFFTTSRLPFDIGCIDWRSVDATDSGIFFQSNRGLYLLPRGFGQPIAINAVQDTLSTYPIITSARSSYNTQGGADNAEQVVQWTAVADETATSGVVITYDITYSAFYVDTCNADYPATFQTGWAGDSVQAPALTTVGPGGASKWHPFRVRDTGHSDGGLAIDMLATTGDIRPWGTFAHGVVNRVGVLMVLGSACTLSLTKTTDRGARATSIAYTGIAPSYVSGDDVYLDVELGKAEQRDITALRFKYFESSAVEGMALIGIIIETGDKQQGFRLLKSSDRIV